MSAPPSPPLPAPVEETPGGLRTAPEWRAFVFKFLILLGIALVAIAGLNYLVNPLGVFAPELLPPVALNTRPAKAKLLSELRPPPQALILGSSRVMKIDPAEIERRTGLRAFNAGVNAAFAEDYYAFLRYAVERAEARPKLVIIGADVESFDDHSPPNEYLLQPNALGRFVAPPEDAALEWRRFTGLFSVLQTKLSFVALYQRLGGVPRQAAQFEADGYLRGDPWRRLKEAGELDVAGRAAEYGARYASYQAPAPERVAYLAKAARYARERGARVVVFLTPIHPDLRARLQPYGYENRRREVADALAQACAAEGCEFFDLTDPQSFAADLGGFHDGAHIDEHNAALLLDKILGGTETKRAVQ